MSGNSSLEKSEKKKLFRILRKTLPHNCSPAFSPPERRGGGGNMTNQIHNRKHLKLFRKELRNNLTSAEATLWKSLQKSQLGGRKFRRQHSVGGFILDFYCPSERLCVELDGAHHFTPEGLVNDQRRTAFLNSVNIRVVRFENCRVFENLAGVLDELKRNFTTPDPS